MIISKIEFIIMKYLYFVIFLFLYSYINFKGEDTLKVKKEIIQLNFEQKVDAFYIKQKLLKNQIEIQKLNLDSIVNQIKWTK